MYSYGNFEGLTGPLELEISYEPYEFDLIGVWIDEERGFYLGTDSGCSCPTPWDTTARRDLTGPLTYEQAAEEISSLFALGRGGGRGDLEEFFANIREEAATCK